MADPSYLAPLIKQILSSPEVDLSVISAKRVREKILVLDPSVEHDYIRRNKAEIDSLIANIFDEVRSGSLDPPAQELNSSQAFIPPSSAHTSPVKRKRSDSPTPSSPPTVAVKEKEKKTPAASKKKTGAMTDEEFARQLDSQLNAVRTRGSSSGSSRAPRKSAGKKVRKSKATVGDDSDEDGDDDDEKPAKKKKRANGGEGGAKGGFGKEFSLSEPLADMLQVSQSSRPQVVKKIWEYIKENGLQNPANKKEIISDTKFRAVFNMDKVGMFQMNKLLGDHLFPLEG